MVILVEDLQIRMQRLRIVQIRGPDFRLVHALGCNAASLCPTTAQLGRDSDRTKEQQSDPDQQWALANLNGQRITLQPCPHPFVSLKSSLSLGGHTHPGSVHSDQTDPLGPRGHVVGFTGGGTGGR